MAAEDSAVAALVVKEDWGVVVWVAEA